MRPDSVSKNKGVALIFVSALMFGSYGVWSRLIGNSFGVFYQSWTRALLLSIVIFPILYFSKQIIPIKRMDWKWMSIFLISTSLTQAPIFYAFNHMDIGTATLLFFTSTLLTMYAFGFLFFGEKADKIKLTSFLIACLGFYITFSFSLIAFSLLVASMAVLNGMASGTELSSSKKLSDTYSALYITWLSWIIIFVTNGIVSFALNEVQYIPSFSLPWAYLVGYAVAGILGFWLAIEGLKYVEASIGGLLGLLEIIFSIGFGILVFNESLTSKVLVGGILIMCAAALPHLAELKRSVGFKRREM